MDTLRQYQRLIMDTLTLYQKLWILEDYIKGYGCLHYVYFKTILTVTWMLDYGCFKTVSKVMDDLRLYKRLRML